MIYCKNKKASLQLSVQSVVIMVLAMTLLGLGIAFIKGMFGDIFGIGRGAFDSIKDELQKKLIGGDEKLVFSQTQLTLERGKSELLGWGVKNEYSAPLDYYVQFKPKNCPTGTDGSPVCPTGPDGDDDINNKWFNFVYGEAYQLGAAENHVKRLQLKVPKGAAPGDYLIRMNVYEDAEFTTVYESTEIFLTVT